MSGIETVKVIVDAEKHAAKIIEEATSKANSIRKGIDPLIAEKRQKMVADANKEVSYIASRAEEEGKREAENFENQSTEELRGLVARASARKDPTVEKLVTMVTKVD